MGKYTIKDMEVISGVKAHTIRIWEKRYALFNPERNENNQRLYNDEELRYLLNISNLVKSGFRISKLIDLPANELEQLIQNTHDKTSKNIQITDELTTLLLDYNEAAISQLIDNLIDKFGFEQAIEEYAFPFLHKVGMLWQTGTIQPVHEHFFTNIIRNKIILETNKYPITKNNSSSSILFFTHEKELHDINLIYYYYFARKNGLKAYYLGVMVPTSNLKQAVQETGANILLTHFINRIEKDELEEYIHQLSTEIPSVKLLLTGQLLHDYKPNLPQNTITIKSKEQFLLQMR
ncbi:MerR family transcriptional regulator [Prolixibacteraceae bacterium JC049]|nr:MerR family transcriptional regulator [Prolixibacteraceae bacterium JC049]